MIRPIIKFSLILGFGLLAPTAEADKALATAITGSTDGLLIVDSLSGECLADRVGRTKGWRQFVLYRVAPQSGAMCVTFALSGRGEARLDDVAIQVAEGPAAMTQR